MAPHQGSAPVPTHPVHVYRKEGWSRKVRRAGAANEDWKTCNHEYGEYKPRIMNMSKRYKDPTADNDPWMTSTYQKGYNMKPENRRKWMESWKGYVQQDHEAGHARSLRKSSQSAPVYQEDWSTGNKDYGSFVPREEIVQMGEHDQDLEAGHWCQSMYQRSYNVKPEMRRNWVESWRGQVQREEPAKNSSFRSINPWEPDVQNRQDEQREAVQDEHPLAQKPLRSSWMRSSKESSIQDAASFKPNKLPPIFKQAVLPDPSEVNGDAQSEMTSVLRKGRKPEGPFRSLHVPTKREKALAANRELRESGEKLPPLPQSLVNPSAQRDILYKDGQIYLATPRLKTGPSRVNENFFGFEYKPNFSNMATSFMTPR